MKKKILNSVLTLTLAIFGFINSAQAQIIAGGANHSLSLCSDNTARAWGRNEHGQLGNGTNINSNLPVQVSSLTGIINISVGYYHSIALKNDGTVWAWGRNDYGQLGNGNNTNCNVPTQVNILAGIIAISGGEMYSIALKNDGTVWTWGKNDFGQLGIGNYTNSNIPLQVSGISNVSVIAGGGSHALALKNDGTVRAWGRNFSGQLGNGTTTQSNVPVTISSLTSVTAIAGGGLHSIALKNDGTVWTWGINNTGQLGNGNTGTISTTPTQVLSDISAIAAGEGHSIALKNDGTIRTWGKNDLGQLGNGTLTDSSIPVQVSGAIAAVTAIEGGFSHSLALKNDGSIRAFGGNSYGKLGNGTNINSTVPVQVTGLCIDASAIAENLIENLISVYPNPSSGIFQMTFDNMQLSKVEIEIYNALGEKVYASSNIKQQMQINLSALSKGIYYVKVYDGTKIYNQKIVFQ